MTMTKITIAIISLIAVPCGALPLVVEATTKALHVTSLTQMVPGRRGPCSSPPPLPPRIFMWKGCWNTTRWRRVMSYVHWPVVRSGSM